MLDSKPNVPAEPQGGLKPEEFAQMDAGCGLFGDAENFQGTFENRSALTVGSTIVKEKGSMASMALLRGATDYLGISKAGAKEKLWSRLHQAAQTLENQQFFQDANRLYKEEAQFKGHKTQAQPRQPSREERALHEHTHLPF